MRITETISYLWNEEDNNNQQIMGSRLLNRYYRGLALKL